MNQRGFTLVELSIVLVIIGLLTGGVLTGQSLIRAAELRSVTSQYSRFLTATQTFRDKYFAIPGDMTNASKYWGAADGSDGNQAACLTAVGTGTQTCNGNGNGQIEQVTSAYEWFRFWQHLANAGLIEGSYTGVVVSGSATAFGSNNTNVPVGRITSSLWFAWYGGTQSASPQFYDGQYSNVFQIGGQTANLDPQTPIFKPEEAYNIDTKMDDGKPATGRVVIRNATTWTTQSCTDATASTALSSSYLLSSTSPGCTIVFRNQF